MTGSKFMPFRVNPVAPARLYFQRFCCRRHRRFAPRHSISAEFSKRFRMQEKFAALGKFGSSQSFAKGKGGGVMSIKCAIVKASFYSRFLYDLLNKIMIKLATKMQEEENMPVVDIEAILKENDLQMVETGFFRQKKTVSRVKDNQENFFILKTGKIDPFQVQLFQVAKSLESKLSFKVPVIIKQGDGWILFEQIEGKSLNEFYEEKPGWCVEMSKKIADDYQLVIRELQKTQPLGNLLAEGQEWLFSRLSMWSKPIIDAGLINFSLVQQIKRELEKAISQRGENFFGWVHGNIIGDHIIVSGNDVYLVDLNVVPRAGKEYHDFLRALDFMFIKTRDEEKVFKAIPGWIKQYLSDFDRDEIKLVFAFRNIGILGWDIIKHKAEEGNGNIERKKHLALRFIKREY